MSLADLQLQKAKAYNALTYTMGVEDEVIVTDSAQKVIERESVSPTQIVDDLATMANTRDSIPKVEGLGVKMRTIAPIPSITASLDKHYNYYGKRTHK